VSRIHDALQKSEPENGRSIFTASEPSPIEMLGQSAPPSLDLDGVQLVSAHVSASARLVALTDPLSLGAEKFRALATRLDNLRRKRELKSVQVTSAAKDDGKTLTSGNLALTMAMRTSSKVLLIEGDLHRPALTTLFGLNQWLGLSAWWSAGDADILHFVRHLKETSLWLLTAGDAYEQPSDILRSARFAKAFAGLTQRFDWIIVDSPPLLPMVDANLWSRLVDGTLLVVREGATRVNALKKGLQSLDGPSLIGVVLNEASEFDQVSQYERYYIGQKNGKPERDKKESREDVV
jgi:capsular exopolysaccharide synthesis family protein